MSKLDIIKLELTEGDLITKDTIEAIDVNMKRMKNRLESIEYAEQMELISDISPVGTSSQIVAQKMEALIDALKLKGFMDNN